MNITAPITAPFTRRKKGIQNLDKGALAGRIIDGHKQTANAITEMSAELRANLFMFGDAMPIDGPLVKSFREFPRDSIESLDYSVSQCAKELKRRGLPVPAFGQMDFTFPAE